jgi:glycosyltransferase involved in cell wall biosynthesis
MKITISTDEGVVLEVLDRGEIGDLSKAAARAALADCIAFAAQRDTPGRKARRASEASFSCMMCAKKYYKAFQAEIAARRGCTKCGCRDIIAV